MLKRGFLVALLLVSAVAQTPVSDTPVYTADGSLNAPAHYREWVFLSSGLDMSYTATQDANPHIFSNTFVNPTSYRAFLATGTWPDGTTIVLEHRVAETPVSINKRGHTQGATSQPLEYHVKDHGKWSFYGQNGNGGATAKLFADSVGCKTCHEGHGAVDTTFVQFYPTLLPVAQQKKTLSEVYLKEMATPAK